MSGPTDLIEDIDPGPVEFVEVGLLRTDGPARDDLPPDPTAEAEPIVVQRSTMRVIDGTSRLQAALRRGADIVPVRFFDGGDRAVLVWAVRANVAQELSAPPDVVTAVVEWIIATRPHWSDRAIASATRLSSRSVAVIRSRERPDPNPSGVRIGRDGRTRPLNTADGRRAAARFLLADPDASLRQIALAAGISVGTARDVRARIHMGLSPVLPPRGRPRSATEVAEQQAASPVTADRLATLAADPSIRYSAAGRLLLRVVGMQVLRAPDWTDLGDAVPLHCAASVAVLARDSAQKWLLLAERLDRRVRFGAE